MLRKHLQTLSNGIRVIHQENPYSNISHCGLIINAGSRNEIKGKEGLAHFIEHVLFKGTRKRKAFHILNRLEIVGGELNAYTTKEETCIYASFISSYYERAIELLTDIVFNSTFPEKELAKEKEIIIDEINSYLDNPSEQIQDDFEEYLFASHSLGNPILGTLETVRSFTKQDILEFIKQNYNTDQIIFSSIGNISLKKFQNLISKYLAPLPKRNTKQKLERFKKNKLFEVRLKKDTFQSHCVIGNTAYGYTHKNKTPLFLLNNYLGGSSMNSRLSLAIREKYGFSYNIESNYIPFRETGMFTIYLAAEQELLAKSIHLVFKELNKLKKYSLGKIQLSQAKQQLKGHIAIAHENKAHLMLAMGKSLLNYGRIYELNEIYKQIDQLTSDLLRDIAREIFDDKNLSMLIFETNKK